MSGTTWTELEPAIKRYLVYCQKSRRLSKNTCSAYKSDLTALLRAGTSEVVTPETLLETLRSIVESVNHKPATIARRIVAAHGFLVWWDEAVAQTAFSRLKFRMKKPKRLPRAIPKVELHMLLNGVHAAFPGTEGQALRLLLLMLSSTGLRISEMCSLRLLDVDTETGELAVFGKGARERIVMIANTTVRDALRDYVRHHRKDLALTAPLFANAWGGHIYPKWVRQRLSRVAEVSGIRRKITPHMFRHTAATLLVEGGVDIRIVQRLLGHASVSTTEIYTHVSDQALRSALLRADVMRGFVN